MGFWANIIEAMRNLIATKQRTLLALLGIVIGTGSVIAMVSIGEIVKNESLKKFIEMGTDRISIDLRDMSGSAPLIGLTEVRVLNQAFPEIVATAPVIRSDTSLNIGNENTFAAQLGVTHNFKALNNLTLKSGRFVSDLDHYRRFCVIGYDIAQTYAAAGRRLELNSDIRIDELRCTVIGVLNRASKGAGEINVNRAILMPISTMSRLFNRATVSTIIARVDANVNQRTLSTRITNWVDHKFQGLAAEVQSPEQIIAQMEEQMQLYTVLLGAIGSISLIVGGVGVMNIMLVSVSERRKEIGIRMAIGARRRDVQNQFLIEALFLSLVGGFLGASLGVGIAWVTANISGWEFIVTSLAIIVGFSVSAGVGIFFGYYPAVQASKLDPITALRSG